MNGSFKGPVCNGQNIVLLTYLTLADIVDFLFGNV